MKSFIQIIIQEKGKNDFRGFCICKYNDERWELRGLAAENAAGAAGYAMAAFNKEYKDWPNYGYQIEDHLLYPNIDIRDIAKACNIEEKHFEGCWSFGSRVELKLADGRTLTLKNGDTSDHYSVECK